jgi:hypothetical protein
MTTQTQKAARFRDKGTYGYLAGSVTGRQAVIRAM